MAYQVARRTMRAARRYSPTHYRAAWKVGQYVGNTIQKYRGSRGGGSSRKAKSVGSLSEQKDVTTLYRRHRAPRRVRRAAKRGMRMFTYRMDKLQSMKTAIITTGSQLSWSPTNLADGQKVIGITMYGYNTNTFAANTDTGNGDVWWIFARENGGDPTASSGSRKLRFRSCTMNYTIQNTFDEGVYMDIYFVIARKNNGSTSDPAVEWNEAIALQSAGNMPSGITNNMYYQVTPFDSGSFGRFWLIQESQTYLYATYGNLFFSTAGRWELCVEYVRFE